MHRLGYRPVGDDLCLTRIHGDTLIRDHKPQELGLGSGELALLCFCIQARLAEACQDRRDMFLMLFEGRGIYQQIIEVDDERPV